MEIFTRITSEPAFAVGVTELVYDARLLWAFYAKRKAHRRMITVKSDDLVWEDELEHDGEPRAASEFDTEYMTKDELELWSQCAPMDQKLVSSSEAADTDSPASDNGRSSLITMAAIERSYNRYNELLQQQNDILDSGADFLAICRGLQNLVNLKTVSIQGSFGPESDDVHLHDPLPRWYSKWSSGFFRHTVSPKSYDEWIRTTEEILVHHDDIRPWMYDPWDWRGVKNCVKSLVMRRSSIRHFHFGCQRSKLPRYILGDSEVSKSLGTIAHDLECLKLDCKVEWKIRRGYDRAVLCDKWLKASDILTKTFGGARHLNTLSLNMDLDYNDTFDSVGDLTWPKLTVLELGDSKMDLDFLKSICQRHRGTLKELKLRNMMLMRENDWDVWDAWNDVGRELGPILQLSDIFLAWSGEAHRSPRKLITYMRQAMEVLGYRLMSSVPRNLLRVRANHELDDYDVSPVEMWHETETRHENRQSASYVDAG